MLGAVVYLAHPHEVRFISCNTSQKTTWTSRRSAGARFAEQLARSGPIGRFDIFKNDVDVIGVRSSVAHDAFGDFCGHFGLLVMVFTFEPANSDYRHGNSSMKHKWSVVENGLRNDHRSYVRVENVIFYINTISIE